MSYSKKDIKIAVIGGGPSGLIAAYKLASYGYSVDLFERKKSLARKFIIAGKGGLNLTYSEPIKNFSEKYDPHEKLFFGILNNFSSADLISWLEYLGVSTFVGTSSRVFPKDKKAPEIVKIIKHALTKLGVNFYFGHLWQGFDENNNPIFENNSELKIFNYNAVLLALGGASYSYTGSDGLWKSGLEKRGILVKEFKPANCGFETNWSKLFIDKYEAQPVKNIKLSVDAKISRGELMLTSYGVEGGAIYSLGKYIRKNIEMDGKCFIHIDLKPDLTQEEILSRLSKPRGKQSISNFLRKNLKISSASFGLLKEVLTNEEMTNVILLSHKIKNLPITLYKMRPIEEAISTAGGIDFSEVDDSLMLKKIPGVWIAGEMIDWEAPTGGYLLQGSFSTGVWAAKGIIDYLSKRTP